MQDDNKSKKGLGEIYEVSAPLFMLLEETGTFGSNYCCKYVYSKFFIHELSKENLLSYLPLYYIFLQEEYVQKTGLVSTALSFSDEQKKEVFNLSPIIQPSTLKQEWFLFFLTLSFTPLYLPRLTYLSYAYVGLLGAFFFFMITLD